MFPFLGGMMQAASTCTPHLETLPVECLYGQSEENDSELVHRYPLRNRTVPSPQLSKVLLQSHPPEPDIPFAAQQTTENRPPHAKT